MSLTDNPTTGRVYQSIRKLRTRILICSGFIAICFGVLYPVRDSIYTFLAAPLLKYLPPASGMIATDVASPFLTPFKLTFTTALFFSAPIILFNAWSLAQPILRLPNKKSLYGLTFMSTVLFYAGTAFPYYLAFPLIFKFFTSFVPEGVKMMTDITLYLDFIMTLFMAFGVAFQIPVLIVILIWVGAVEPDALRKSRPYIIIGCFVIGMILTPPDIFSQTMLALPMWLLFEFGLLLGGLARKGSAA